MDYNKQAEDFLRETKTALEVKISDDQKAPTWGSPHGLHYKVTLSNDKHKYTFDFWDSLKNAEIYEAVKNYERVSFRHSGEDYRREDIIKKDRALYNAVRSAKKADKEAILKTLYPKAYDILACLSPLYEDSFEDFCSSYGYETDSIKANEIYKNCIEQDRNLRKLFNHEEMDKLAYIQ